jgi:hypothetical protein
MSKSAATVEFPPHPTIARAKRARKPRPPNAAASDALSPSSPNRVQSRAFPTKPLLVGVGIGAALALTAVALGSRPERSAYFGTRPPTVAGAFAKAAAVLLARVVARKALAVAANQGARKLAHAWPL